jgi:hypothetical protein
MKRQTKLTRNAPAPVPVASECNLPASTISRLAGARNFAQQINPENKFS